MKTYLVGYDLNKPGQDYDDLFTACELWLIPNKGMAGLLSLAFVPKS